MLQLGAEANAADVRFWLGCGLELTSTVLQNTGMYLQTKAHLVQMMGGGGRKRTGRNAVRATHASSAPGRPEAGPSYWKNWRWWVAFGIFIVGVVLDFVALAFLPLTVSVPVGSAGLVVALLCSHFGLHERIAPYDIVGILLIIGGACMTVWFSPRERPTLQLEDVRVLLDPGGTGLWYELGMIGVYLFWIALSFLAPCSITASVLPGLNGVQTMIFGKMVGELLLSTIGGRWDQLNHYEIYLFILALAVSLLLQNHFLQRALSTYDNMIVIPVYYVVICIMNCVTSLLFFKDFVDISAGAAGAFAAGICVLCAGCCFLTATHFRNPNRIEAIPAVWRGGDGCVVLRGDIEVEVCGALAAEVSEPVSESGPAESGKPSDGAGSSSLEHPPGGPAHACATACAIDQRLAPEKPTLISQMRRLARGRGKAAEGARGQESWNAILERGRGARNPAVVEIAVAYASDAEGLGDGNGTATGPAK